MISKLFWICFVVLLSSYASLAGLDLTEDQYPFPVKDPYLASLFGLAAPSDDLNFIERRLRIRPERSEIKEFNYRIQLRYHYLAQTKSSASLVVILPGLGGSSSSGLSMSLGGYFFSQGHHVLTLPSSFSYQYALAVSETTLPGFLPKDAEETYDLIKRVIEDFRKQTGKGIQDIHLVGYSYGGIMGAFLSQVDANAAHPKFSSFLLINPAVDVAYGVQKLDWLYSVGDQWSWDYKQNIYGSIFNFAESKFDLIKRDPLNSILTFMKENKYGSQEVQWLIGDQFRRSLADVILASHLYQNRGLLKSPYSRYHLNAVGLESRTYTFSKYLDDVVLPSLGATEDPIDWIYSSSMYSLADHLKSDLRVQIFHNRDDFLLKEGDLSFLRQTFGSRLYLFPFGGHLGNLLSPQHLKLYEGLLKH